MRTEVDLAVTLRTVIILLLVTTTSGCTPENDQCASDEDCCSNSCVTNICIGCTVSPHVCARDGECCSKNCYGRDVLLNMTGTCQEGDGCTVENGLCHDYKYCCSWNCHNGQCEPGENQCTTIGGYCTFAGKQCCPPLICEGDRCRSPGQRILPTTTLIVSAMIFKLVLKLL